MPAYQPASQPVSTCSTPRSASRRGEDEHAEHDPAHGDVQPGGPHPRDLPDLAELLQPAHDGCARASWGLVDRPHDVAAGLHIKGTEFLGKVATEEETLEVSPVDTALSLEGWYLERMYKWCDRVGLDAIRKQVVDDVANRKALFSRFADSQQFSQSDPWAARAKRGVDRNESPRSRSWNSHEQLD